MDIMDIDDDYKNIYRTLIKFKTALGSDTDETIFGKEL